MRDPLLWLQRGYDIHVVFPPHRLSEARTMMAAFLAFLGERDIPHERPILFESPVGPWTTPMWQVLLRHPERDVLSRHIGDCIPWLMANRDAMSVMIHPGSADGDHTDHRDHALWLGTPTPLKLDIFSQ
jgi:aromatic ring-cleaving dioxygenase